MSLLLTGVGSPVFDFRTIADLSWWVDAADPTTVFDTPLMAAQLVATGTCGRWNDKGSLGYHWSQNTLGNRPTWTTGLQNGRPGMVCDSSDFFDTVAKPLPLGSSITAFAVAKVTAAAAYMTICEGDNSSFVARWNNANPGKAEMVSSGIAAVTAATSAVATGVASLTMFQYTAAGGGVYRQNGAANGTGVAVGTMSGNTTSFLMAGDGVSFPFQSTLHEWLVWTRALTATEIAQVEAALNTKWAIY